MVAEKGDRKLCFLSGFVFAMEGNTNTFKTERTAKDGGPSADDRKLCFLSKFAKTGSFCESSLHRSISAVYRQVYARNIAGCLACKEDCGTVQFAFISVAFHGNHGFCILLEEV